MAPQLKRDPLGRVPKKIRIVSCPPGEAPAQVRQAWIGLELPLPSGRRSRRQTFLVSGALSRPRELWRQLLNRILGRFEKQSGYAVNALEAVNLLAAKDPAAAAWWRDNCGHFLDGRQHLVFEASACEECE